MKPKRCLIECGVIICALMLPSCAQQNNFTKFLFSEIGALGGKTYRIDRTLKLSGSWEIKRDQFGAAIDTVGIQFAEITNLLTSAYGEPNLYTGANNRHGAVYLYPVTNTGISVFVTSTKGGAEITLTKPLNP